MPDSFNSRTAYISKLIEMMDLEHRDIKNKYYAIEQQLPDGSVKTFYQNDSLVFYWKQHKHDARKQHQDSIFTNVRTHLYFVSEYEMPKI